MTNGKKRIKLIAHLAVQNALHNEVLIEDRWYWDGTINVLTPEWKQRQLILNKLESHGYGRFILNKDLKIDSSVSVYRKKDELDGNWTHYDIYNVSEVQAYLTYIQDTDSPLEYIKGEHEHSGSYSGPGRAFSNSSVVYQRRTRILVNNSGGLDI